MSAVSVNTFPAINALDSRSITVATILLLHIGFFFALNNGLSFSALVFKPGDLVVVPTEEVEPPPITRPKIPEPSQTWGPFITTPAPSLPPIDTEDTSIRKREDAPTPTGGVARIPVPVEPVIIEPAIPASGLSEPLYPVPDIRAGNTGTVLLSLEILPNGRVGQIRLLQSSGYARLDQSALKEARKWRFVPGKRDGVPVVLWKEVPITFELQNRN
jgi:periplasmic protein TonB